MSFHYLHTLKMGGMLLAGLTNNNIKTGGEPTQLYCTYAHLNYLPHFLSFKLNINFINLKQ